MMKLPIIQTCGECGWHRKDSRAPHTQWCEHPTYRPEWSQTSYPPPNDCPLRREVPERFPEGNTGNEMEAAGWEGVGG